MIFCWGGFERYVSKLAKREPLDNAFRTVLVQEYIASVKDDSFGWYCSSWVAGHCVPKAYARDYASAYGGELLDYRMF